MLRIWDRIRLGEGTEVHKDFHPQVIIADEIGEAILGGHEPTYPICAPPFDQFVIEMRPSPWPFVIEAREAPTAPLHSTHEAIGMLAVFNVEKDSSSLIQHLKKEGDIEHTEEELEYLIGFLKGPEFGWLIEVTVEYEFTDAIMPVYGFGVVVRLDGSLEGIGYPFSGISNKRLSDKETPEFIAAQETLYSTLMAISLLNCSNVGTVEAEPTYRRQEKRRLMHAELPLISYKTLAIKPHLSASSGSKGDGSGVAIHIVRGHFKTYTDEAPLFGSMTGTWWWQPQARGSKPRIVIKDYEVENE